MSADYTEAGSMPASNGPTQQGSVMHSSHPYRRLALVLCLLLTASAPALGKEAPRHAGPPVVFPERADLPRVIGGANGRRLLGPGDAILAGDLAGRDASRYYLLRPGRFLHDPGSGRILGRRTLVLGEAQVLRHGNPGLLHIERVSREVRPGDYLLAISDGPQADAP